MEGGGGGGGGGGALREELAFLALHWLAGGACAGDAADALAKDAEERGLLPSRVDVFGRRHAQSYRELARQHAHVAPDHLERLLARLLDSDAGAPQRAMGARTLIGAGEAALVRADAAAQDGAPGPATPALTCWPRRNKNLLGGLLCREGAKAAGVRPSRAALAPPALVLSKVGHLCTFRGHRNAVYCSMFDRSGRHILTGSDDRLVKIWSAETGMLQRSCRGHAGDIVDLAVSSDNTMFASACNQRIVRTWRLDGGAIGTPIATLLAHEGAVTSLAFCPTVAHMLVSTADDGTLRLWDARSSAVTPITLPAQRATAAGAAPPPPNKHLMCCAFSPNGEFFAAGSNAPACVAHVWRLRAEKMPACGKDGRAPPVTAECITAMRDLANHNNDIGNIHFSHASDRLLTASKDGTIKIWVVNDFRSEQTRPQFSLKHALATQALPEDTERARRGRRAPQAPGINLAVWTLDDRFIVAAVGQGRLSVWDATSGAPVHNIQAHSSSAYVVSESPLDPRLVLSAGYDGRVLIVDIVAGCVMRAFDGDALQAIDGFQLVDAQWAPDGTAIVVSDSAGQFSLFGTSDRGRFRGVKYDQFFASDYNQLITDTNGNVVDAPTQQPPHIASLNDPICDFMLTPYPEPYQSAFRSGRVSGTCSTSDYDAPAAHAVPLSMAGTAWQARGLGAEGGLPEGGLGSALPVPPPPVNPRVTIVSPEIVLPDSSSSSEHESDDPDVQEDDMPEGESDSSSSGASARSGSSDGSDGDNMPHTRARGPPAGARSTRSRRRESDGPRHSTRGARNRNRGQQGAGSRPRRRRARFSDSDEFGSELELDDEELHNLEDDDEGIRLGIVSPPARRRGAKKKKRTAVVSSPEPSQDEAGPSSRREKKRRRVVDSSGSDDDDDEDEPVLDDDDSPDEAPASDDDSFEAALMSDSDGEEQRRGKKPAKAGGSSKRGGGSGRRKGKEPAAGDTPAPAPRGRGGSSINRTLSALKTREYSAYGWLLDTQPPVGPSYIPQLGDDVVYVAQAHYVFLEDTSNRKHSRPWVDMPGFRMAEPCTVVDVQYAIVHNGGDSTVANLTLKLTDERSPLAGKTFSVELPDMMGQIEFLVAQTRFVTAERKNWARGDRCAVYWPPGENVDEPARWWTGQVIDVLDVPPEWPGSPYNRLRVIYDHSQDGDATCEHSMWELYDEEYVNNDGGVNVTALAQLVQAEKGLRATIPEDVCDRLKSVVSTLCRAERYGAFRDVIGPKEAFGDPARNYVSEIPLPIALVTLRERLMSSYYRQVAALVHDVETLRNNSAIFNGEDSPLTEAADNLVSTVKAAVPEELPTPTPPEVQEYAAVPVSQEAPQPTRTRVRLRLR